MKDGKYVILVVDDDQDIRDSVGAILQAEGYDVQTAATGEEGLQSFNETNPDLVIADLMMEEIDAGTTFVTKVRAQGADIPIYMLTSVGDDMNRNAAYTDLGLTGILQKPVSPSTLISTVKSKLK